MAKIVLPTIASTTDVSLINENFRKIAEDLNTKVLYRKNPVGESNTLDTNMDANGKQIYNLPAPTLEHQAARYGDIKGAFDAAIDAAEAATTALAASDLAAVASGVAVDAAADALDVVDDVEAFALAAASSAANASSVLADAARKSETVVSILRFIPPSQWSAILDGTSTYDAAPAISSAINGSGSESEFFFPGKLYCIGSTGIDVISKTGVVLYGNATIKCLAQSSLTVMTLGRTSIRFSSCVRSGIRGLKFNLNGIAQMGVGFVSCTEYFADRCEAYGGLGIAQMASVGGLRGKWTNNISRDPAASGATRGIWIGNISLPEMEAEVSVIGNHCLRNTATGIVVTSVGGEVVANRSCNNNGSGIIFPGANGYSAKNISASGNTCNSNTFHGFQSDIVYTTDADLSQDITLTGNTCNDNYNSGIYAINSRGWTVVGNTCLNNNADAVGTGYGIQADDRSYDITISSNNCSDTRSGAARTQSGGIRATSQAFSGRNITIVGNTCKNNLSDGIFASVAAGLTLSGLSVLDNNCSGNGSRGVMFTETTVGSMGLTLSGNTCLGNTTQDMRASVLDANIGSNRYATQQEIQSRDFDALATTPSVMGRRDWRANNASATTITSFPNAVDGALINIRSSNSNTTIQHSGGVVLKGATNVVIPTDGYITLRRESSVWREMSRSF